MKGDVSSATLDIDGHPQIAAAQLGFTSQMDTFATSLQYCPKCKERYFNKGFKREDTERTICKDCLASQKNNNNILKFGAENDMDPFFGRTDEAMARLAALPPLSDMEEALIARNYVVMKSFIFSNGSMGFRGQVLNMEQDISPFVEQLRLPRRVEEIPVYIVRKPNSNTPEGYKDFKVRREALRLWLEFLIQFNPYYAADVLSTENLDEYPENGSVASRVRTVDIEEEIPPPDTDSDPASTDQEPQHQQSQHQQQQQANNDDDDDDDDDDFGPVNEQELGPAQGGASGAPAEENQVEENYMSRPVQQTVQQRVQLEATVRQYFGADQTLPWPTAGRVLSDYNTPGIQAQAFPTLFPFGRGDVTMKDRLVEVTMTEANKHYLTYAVWNETDEIWVYPFAEHRRWVHWAQNTAERHRVNGQKSVYLHQSDEAANLSEADLREIVTEGGQRLDSLLGRMQTYNANINGSNAYLYQWKSRLEALMDQEGMSSIWFSLSMADNHWADLHRALDPGREARVFASEKEAAKFRRNMARNNPHLVDAFFFERVKVMLKTFFGNQGFGSSWNWIRGELQNRGVYHAHGCLRLKNDPDFTLRAIEVYRGRQAQRFAKKYKVHLDVFFPESSMVDDVWVHSEDEFPEEVPWDDARQQDVIQKIQTGVEAEAILTAFQTLLLSTMHPEPPMDAGADSRHESTE